MKKIDKVESISSLISAMEVKKAEAEDKRSRLKVEMDRLLDEAGALEDQAAEKTRRAKDLYERMDSLDYGDWVRDVIRPLADEMARRTGKKAQVLRPIWVSVQR